MTQNMPDFYSDLTEGGAETSVTKMFPSYLESNMKAEG